MSAELQPTNGYQVCGWMVTDLHLQGYELQIFALIHNYTQGRAGRYTGGIGFICDWFGISKPTAIKYLQELTGKGLIEREETTTGGVTFVHYSLGKEILPLVKNFYHPGKEILPKYEDNNTPPVDISPIGDNTTTPQGARRPSSSDILQKFIDLGCEASQLQDWKAARKGAPITQAVLDGMVREARKAGITLAEAVRICAENSWRGFRAEYLERTRNNKGEVSVMEGMRRTAAKLGFDFYGGPQL